MQDRILTQLLEIDSSTHTENEVQMAETIARIIGEHPYFKSRPEQFGLYEVEQDIFRRKIPWAIYLAQNQSRQTLVLTGHLDTIPSDNYGALKQYALTPEELEKRMRLESLPADVQADLESGEWIFGRGTADMKGGLSVFLKELLRACDNRNLNVNLLFFAVPDEETYSAGMRSAVSLLLHLREKYGLDYQLLLMGESHHRENNRALYFDGTIGKMQINIVVKGVPVHSRYYYTGMNPVQLAAQIACDIDGNPELAEQIAEEKTPPPCVMYCRDTKTRYDVTLPESVDMAVSFLTYRRSGKQILEILKEKINSSIEAVVSRGASQYAQWAASIPAAPARYEQSPSVLYYEQLVSLARQKGGKDFDAYYSSLKAAVSQELNSGTIQFNDATLKMVHELLAYVDQPGPVVVLAITPPLYPGFTNCDIVPEGSLIRELPEQLCRFSRDVCGQEAGFAHYFAGISDMSYAATAYTASEREFIHQNVPVWGESYSIDFDGIARLQIPVMNVGPWGKNIHTKLERVHCRSLSQECPQLIHWITRQIEKHALRGNTAAPDPEEKGLDKPGEVTYNGSNREEIPGLSI